MKKINLGQVIQIAANVGVLAGLLLLAFEVNQNREIIQAQTRHGVFQGIIDHLLPLAIDGELAEMSLKNAGGSTI